VGAEITLSESSIETIVARVAETLGVTRRSGRRPVGLQVAKLPPAITPDQAQAYTGRCRTAVFEFMRQHPHACEVDAAGIRRVKTHWLDAWCTSREHVEALERHAARHAGPKLVPFSHSTVV
jgi:hypothetical protein